MFLDFWDLGAYIYSATGECCLQELFGNKWELSIEIL